MGASSSHQHHHEPLGGPTVGTGAAQCPNANNNSGQPLPPMSRTKSLRRSLRKHKKPRPYGSQVEKSESSGSKRMDRLRRSFRDSFRKKKDPHIPEASKPHQWQMDEEAVRNGTCQFHVKYLGCVEVFESRGMQVCEEALKVLRCSRRRPVRGILHVSGDGLRVVDDETKGLIVDQTIEKVSFCAPDRNHEKGFSYICRDGTTRRWMCHGFIALKETGERLSHAVGCAFASCLERKQKRDKECGVTMSFDTNSSTFTRVGSFKQMSLTERISDPQDCKPAVEPPVKKVDNPHAIARPHATPLMLQRQGSFRVFQHLNQSSPFKRQLSLRLNDLPSNLERTRSMSLDNSASLEDASNTSSFNNNIINNELNQPQPVTPIPESSPLTENKSDPVSAMCKELSAGLSLLTNYPDPFNNASNTTLTSHTNQALASPTGVLLPTVQPIREENPWSGANTILSTSIINGSSNNTSETTVSNSFKMSKGEEWLAQIKADPLPSNGVTDPPNIKSSVTTQNQLQRRNPHIGQLRSTSLGNNSSHPPLSEASTSWISTNGDSSSGNMNNVNNANGGRKPGDPFDAEWAQLASRSHNPNNPFLQTTVTKAFEVQM